MYATRRTVTMLALAVVPAAHAQQPITPYEAVGDIARFGAGLELTLPDMERAEIRLADTAFVVLATLYRSRDLRWLYPRRRDDHVRYGPGVHAVRVRELRGNGLYASSQEWGQRRESYGRCVASGGGGTEVLLWCRAWWMGPLYGPQPSDGVLSQRDAEVLMVSAAPIDTARLRAALRAGRDSLSIAERLIRAYEGEQGWAAYIIYGLATSPGNVSPRPGPYSPPPGAGYKP